MVIAVVDMITYIYVELVFALARIIRKSMDVTGIISEFIDYILAVWISILLPIIAVAISVGITAWLWIA